MKMKTVQKKTLGIRNIDLYDCFNFPDHSIG